jgi:hypothetical protein
LRTITDYILNREISDTAKRVIVGIITLLDNTYHATDGQSVTTIGRLLADWRRHPDVQANKELTEAISIATQIIYAEANHAKDAAAWRDSLPTLDHDDFTYGGWLVEVISGKATTPNGSKLDLDMMFKYLDGIIERATHPEEYFFRSQYLAELIEDESLPDEMRKQLREAVGLNGEQTGKALRRVINRILLDSRKSESVESRPLTTEDQRAEIIDAVRIADKPTLDAIEKALIDQAARKYPELSIRELIDNAQKALVEMIEHPECPKDIKDRFSVAAMEAHNNDSIISIKALFVE